MMNIKALNHFILHFSYLCFMKLSRSLLNRRLVSTQHIQKHNIKAKPLSPFHNVSSVLRRCVFGCVQQEGMRKKYVSKTRTELSFFSLIRTSSSASCQVHSYLIYSIQRRCDFIVCSAITCCVSMSLKLLQLHKKGLTRWFFVFAFILNELMW